MISHLKLINHRKLNRVKSALKDQNKKILITLKNKKILIKVLMESENRVNQIVLTLESLIMTMNMKE